MNPDPMLSIHTGDALTVLKTLPGESVQMCCTSPPYFGLRSYAGGAQEIGQEKTPDEFVANLVAVFREVRRVLKGDGVTFVNLGDSYAGGGNGGGGSFAKNGIRYAEPGTDKNKATRFGKRAAINGIKPKDLIGIPWMAAFALRADGWWLRSEITWCKKAPMPESCTDRPSSATEKIFLLSKSQSYFYDSDAVRNPPCEAMLRQVEEGYNGHATKLFEENGVQDASGVKSRIIEGARKRVDKQRGHSRRHAGFNDRWDGMTKAEQMTCGSNMRNYWLLGPEPSAEAHFATYPTEIPRRCILAGSRPGDTVLDCFAGTFTTCMVALELGRRAIGIELNPEYVEIGKRRCQTTLGLGI